MPEENTPPEATEGMTIESSIDGTISTSTPNDAEESFLEEGRNNNNNNNNNNHMDDDENHQSSNYDSETTNNTGSGKNKKKVLFNLLKNRRGSDSSFTSSSSNHSESINNNKSPPRRQLSIISKKYDIDGDGTLNDAEQAMRDLDVSGRGHISNERVFKLMMKQTEMQSKLLNFKRVLIGLGVLTFILALSNLGTAWVAAKLAKDTSVENGKLVDKNNKKVTIATDANIKVIEIIEHAPTKDQRLLRMLQQNFTSHQSSTILRTDAVSIYHTCPQEVWLKRTSISGVEQNIKLCGSGSNYGPTKDGNTYKYPTGPYGLESVEITCDLFGIFCDLSGSALDLRLGDTCNPTYEYECRSNKCNTATNTCYGGTNEDCTSNDQCLSTSCSPRPVYPPVDKCDECNSQTGNHEGCDVAAGELCYDSNFRADVFRISHVDGGCYKPLEASCSTDNECISNTCQNGSCRCKVQLSGWSGSDWGCNTDTHTCVFDSSVNHNKCELKATTTTP